jgi:8-oxo-dGTP diphosphatase
MSEHLLHESPFYRVSVKALIFDDQQRLLVMREADGGWEIPGGGWEHDETLTQCVERELAEELGVQAVSVDESRMIPCVGPGNRYHRLKLAVAVRVASHQFTLGDGMQEIRWVTREQFVKLPVDNGDEVLQAQRDLL